MIQIFHNPQCSKSRKCLDFLESSETEYEVVKYLSETPDFEEMKTLIEKLGVLPIDLVRKKEKIWKEHFKDKVLTNDQVIQALVDYPALIERPILIKGNKAIIGRDLEIVSPFISDL